MTSTDTQLTNGSYPITIGNRLLQASVLSDRDYSTIDEFIQSKVIEVARRAASDLAPTERTELLQAAIKAAASSGWGTMEGSKILSTREGTTYLGWVMCRKKQPNLDYEDFVKLISKSEDDAMDQIALAYQKLHLIINEVETPQPEESKS